MFIHEKEIIKTVDAAREDDKMVTNIKVKQKQVKKTHNKSATLTNIYCNPGIPQHDADEYYAEVEESLRFIANDILLPVGRDFARISDIDLNIDFSEDGSIDDSFIETRLVFNVHSNPAYQESHVQSIFSKVNKLTSYIYAVTFAGHKDGLCHLFVDFKISVTEFRKKKMVENQHELQQWVASLHPIFEEIDNRTHFEVKYKVMGGKIIVTQTTEKDIIYSVIPQDVIAQWRG